MKFYGFYFVKIMNRRNFSKKLLYLVFRSRKTQDLVDCSVVSLGARVLYGLLEQFVDLLRISSRKAQKVKIFFERVNFLENLERPFLDLLFQLVR